VSWQGKRVLVTGAGGFVGSHLTERLAALGAETRALVHYRSNGSWGWLDDSGSQSEIEVIVGDIRDRDRVAEAMQGREVVFHLAALVGIPYSYHAPMSYIHTNVEGTVNVLQAARDVGVERLVQTSTSEVYGTARYVPIDEEHQLQGQSPYAASKIGSDKMAEAFHCSFGLPVATIRPFNVYGPRQSARAVIPTIITQALTESTVRLGNLKPNRDFNYVADTVEGFLRVAECPEAVGNVFNIGSGREISIGNLANLVLDLVGRPDVTIVQNEGRVRPGNSEVDRLLADNSRARDILKWCSNYSLEKGLAHTIEWVRENIEQYQSGIYSV